MAQQLVEIGPSQSETEAKRNIAAAVKATASKLGNRPAACRKYYIHPAVFESYDEQTIFATMRPVSGGKARSAVRLEEMALIRLVKSYVNSQNTKSRKAS